MNAVTFTMPSHLAFTFNVSAPNGVGSSGTTHGVRTAIARGLNLARWLMRPESSSNYPHIDVTIEVICSMCCGEKTVRGKRPGSRVPCKSCKGGKLEHPISGDLALRYRVYRGGFIATADEPTCDCSERPDVGALCPSCGRGNAP